MFVLVSETAPPKRTALVCETMVKLCPNLGLGMSPVALILSGLSNFIQKLTFKIITAIVLNSNFKLLKREAYFRE